MNCSSVRPLLLAALSTLAACGSGVPVAVAVARLHGDMVGDQLGADLAPAGDVDGDGRPDLLVGASQFLTQSPQPGYVRVLSGDGRLIHTLRGASGADGFGASVLSIDDADGDGVRDIVVGAPFADVGHPDAGSIQLFSGRSGAPLWTAHGQRGGDGLGVALAPLGDVDGDGTGDLAAAALQRAMGPGHDPGKGYVTAFSGVSGEPLFTTSGGPQALDLGRELAPLGDLDGDGLPELAAAAPASQAVLYLSGRDGSLVLRVDDLSAGFGSALASAGDLDRDGYPDLLVGAPLDSLEAPMAGAVHVLSGVDGATLLVARGAEGGVRLGKSVAALPDLTDDGIPELAAGPSGGGPIRILSGADGRRLLLIDPGEKEFDFGAGLTALERPSGSAGLAVGFPGVGPMGNSAGGVVIMALDR